MASPTPVAPADDDSDGEAATPAGAARAVGNGWEDGEASCGGEAKDGEALAAAHARPNEARYALVGVRRDSLLRGEAAAAAARAQLPQPPARCGYLLKRTRGLRAKWARRWFHLEAGELLVYGEEEPCPRARVALLATAASDASADGAAEAELLVRTPARDYVLRAASLDEAREWLAALAAHRAAALRAAAPAPAPAPASAPAPGGPMAAEAAARECSTGDVLLFQTRSLSGGVIRAATGGAFDHVGVLLRFSEGELGVLETLANTGAQVSSFRGFIDERWHEQYSRICVRRLRGAQLDAVALARVEDFVQTVNGRGYRWRPRRLRGAEAQLDFRNPKRLFFCSELVAALFIHLGLLRDSLSAAAYAPVHFEQRAGLALLGGASLGEEVQLLF
jgi:DNA-binding response OmpR family regulator